jgi:hypothetical protein
VISNEGTGFVALGACIANYRTYILPSDFALGACMSTGSLHVNAACDVLPNLHVLPTLQLLPAGAVHVCAAEPVCAADPVCAAACITNYRTYILPPDFASTACMPNYRTYILPSGACMSTGSLHVNPVISDEGTVMCVCGNVACMCQSRGF